MGRKLYVGNLPYSANEQSVRDAFSKCGTVSSVSIISDRDTGQSAPLGRHRVVMIVSDGLCFHGFATLYPLGVYVKSTRSHRAPGRRLAHLLQSDHQRKEVVLT